MISKYKNLLIDSMVAKNLYSLVFSEIVIRLAKFLILVYAARELGSEQFGIFNYVLALAALIAIIGDFGINKIITRNIAKDRSLINLHAQSFVVQSILLGVYCLIGTAAVYLVSGWGLAILFLFLAMFTASNVLGDYVWSFFRAFEEMSLEAKAKTFQSIVILILGAAVLYWSGSIIYLGVVYAVGAFSTLILGTKWLFKRAKGIFKLNLSSWITLVKQSWPIAIVSISAFIFNQVDSIMLGILGLYEQVGLYNAGYKIIGALLIPAIILNQVLYPRFSRLIKKSSQSLVRLNLVANAAMYSLVAIIIYAFGSDILQLVYGVEYVSGALAFFWLSLALLLTALVMPLSSWSISQDYLKINLGLSVAAAILNIVLNIILIPKYGYEGAALGTIITYGFLLVGYSSLLIKPSRNSLH